MGERGGEGKGTQLESPKVTCCGGNGHVGEGHRSESDFPHGLGSGCILRHIIVGSCLHACMHAICFIFLDPLAATEIIINP